MPIEAAAVYFMIGNCFTELHNPTAALDAFNHAIKVNPDYAEVSNLGIVQCSHRVLCVGRLLGV